LALFLGLPLTSVFFQALQKGLGAYVSALTQPDARAAHQPRVASAQQLDPGDDAQRRLT
jgi:ABC-type sulfate transport system permease subunit